MVRYFCASKQDGAQEEGNGRLSEDSKKRTQKGKQVSRGSKPSPNWRDKAAAQGDRTDPRVLIRKPEGVSSTKEDKTCRNETPLTAETKQQKEALSKEPEKLRQQRPKKSSPGKARRPKRAPGAGALHNPFDKKLQVLACPVWGRPWLASLSYAGVLIAPTAVLYKGSDLISVSLLVRNAPR